MNFATNRSKFDKAQVLHVREVVQRMEHDPR
jgi:hypothetical protein